MNLQLTKYGQFYLIVIYRPSSNSVTLKFSVRQVWQLTRKLRSIWNLQDIENNRKTFIACNLYFQRKEKKMGDSFLLFEAFYRGGKIQKDLENLIILNSAGFILFRSLLMKFVGHAIFKYEDEHFHSGQISYLKCPYCYPLPRWGDD